MGEDGREEVSNVRESEREKEDVPGPKMTAFHSMILSGHGLPEIPPGGSVESRLKSRMRRLRQFVDCVYIS